MNYILLKIIIALYSFIVTNPSIPQDVKDQALQVIGQNADIIQTTQTSCNLPAAVTTVSEPATLAAPVQPTIATPVSPSADGIDFDPHISSSTKDIRVLGKGFNSSVSVKIHGTNLEQDLALPGISSLDGTNFSFILPGNFPAGVYVLYVYQDGKHIMQNIGQFEIGGN